LVPVSKVTGAATLARNRSGLLAQFEGRGRQPSNAEMFYSNGVDKSIRNDRTNSYIDYGLTEFTILEVADECLTLRSLGSVSPG
jgi:hypothetical protein